MGILANTVSVCQFRVLGDMPGGSGFEWVGAKLAAQGFRSIAQGSEEISVGWVHLDDPDESGFELPSAYWRDHYLLFSLRKDQRRVPAALLRGEMERAEAEFLAAHPGLHKVPKSKREELKEAIRGSLLARTLPTPSTWDAVWDTRTGVVSFTSLSAKVIEQFESLFKTTFDGLRLVPVHPYARAEAVGGDELASALAAANRAVNDGVLELIRDNEWIGADFLRWLMYQTLHEACEYKVDQQGPALKGESFVAYVNDRLIMLGGSEDGVQKITVAGPQDHFREVCTALDSGKQITESTIYLEKGEEAWKLTLKAPVFQFGSLRCPGVKLEKDAATDEAAEREAIFFERMYLLETGLQLFDSLFAAFLRERLGEAWNEREKAIREWLSAA